MNVKPILEFYNFLKFPEIEVSFDGGYEEATKETTMLFFMVFALEIVFLFPLLGLIGVEDIPHAMELLSEKMNHWLIFVLAVIIAPVIEEFIFRFPLKYEFSIKLFASFLIGLLAYLMLGMFSIKLATASSILLFMIGMWYLSKNEIRKVEFSFLFYMVAVVFAFVHIFNFDFDQMAWWQAPILVLPQFTLGLLLGFVRIKYGIVYSILVHSLNNAIPMLLMFAISK